MADPLAGYTVGPTNPIGGANAVTPNDSQDLATYSRAIYCGTGGDLKADLVYSSGVVLKNLAAGVVHPIRVKRVYATGTTAADILAFY